MSRLYKNRYRIDSTRLQSWDYSWNAAYFVTICTHHRVCHFGNVVDGVMQLSENGLIADKCWLEIPDHFPFVKLGNHVVMPNHIHGIAVIDRHDDEIAGVWGVDGGGYDTYDDGDGGGPVETQNFASLPIPTPRFPPPSTHQNDDTPKNKFGSQSQNLASIIRGFKIGVTQNARSIDSDFKWQPRYHEHIIRDETAYQRISEYISNNPRNWRDDQFFK